MARRSKVTDIDVAISQILEEYHQSITDGMREAIVVIAENAKKRIKNDSPVKSGAYKKGWNVQTDPSRISVGAIVHNRTRYQLAHLLEHGHGGPVHARAIVHIAPAEQEAIKEFEKAVERIAQGQHY